MADLLNLAMLICACIAAITFGIFAAYGILKVVFAIMRPRPRQTVKARPEMAQVS
jgi:hypothetical protein